MPGQPSDRIRMPVLHKAPTVGCKRMSKFKPFFIFTVTIGLLSLFSCGDKSKIDKNIQVTELDTISFDDLSKKAYEYLNKQQDICNTVYRIHSYENWFYDQLTGELTFSDKGVKKLIIDYEEVGSVSEVTNTFLWAWANPHLEGRIKSDIIKVREYGHKRSFDKLVNSKWTADQYDGWEMTAISSYLMQTKGAYRVPHTDNKLFSFLIFKNIRWADTTNLN